MSYPFTARDGALLVLLGVLIIVAHLVPEFRLFAGLALLVLAGFLARERNGAYVLALVVLAGATLALVFHSADPALLVAEFGLLGVFYGVAFKNGVAPGRILFGGILASQVILWAGLALVYFVLGENPFDAQLLIAGSEALSETEQEMLRLMATLVPGSYVVGAWLTAVIGFFGLERVLAHRRTADSLLAFSDWRLPWVSIWIVIAGLGAYLAGDQWQMPILVTAGANTLVVAAFVFATAGLGVVAEAGYFRRLSRLWRILLLAAMLVYFPVVFMALTILGFLDVGFNYRNWFRRKEGKS